jgi:hypothetical protein
MDVIRINLFVIFDTLRVYIDNNKRYLYFFSPTAIDSPTLPKPAITTGLVLSSGIIAGKEVA